MFLFGHQTPHASAPLRHQHRLLALLALIGPLMLLGCQKAPTQGATKNELKAVIALSANDVWAVGGMSTPKHAGFQVLIEHWDGASWNTAMPDLPGELCALSAISASDIWAVGGSGSCNGGGQLLTVHWDGQRWRQISVPVDASGSQVDGTFTAVAALSPLEVWAVGRIGAQALIEHWDGTRWQVTPQPFSARSFALQAIAAPAANDIWTVGFAVDTQGNRFSLAERWDGHSWQVTPMPGYAQDARLLGDPDFIGLAAFSPGQVWAVGNIELSSVYQPTPLIERWDGIAWRVAYGSAPSQPSPSTPGSALQAVAAVNAQDAWAVGNASASAAGKIGHVLIVHWDGHSWLPVNAPSVGLGSQLSALGVLSANDIWAVGGVTLDYSGNSQTLIEHWDGRLWRAVPGLNPGAPGPPLGSG